VSTAAGRREMPRLSMAVLILLTSGAPLRGQQGNDCLQAYLRIDALRSLQSASTAEELERRGAALSYQDAATRIVYAVRLSELAQVKASDSKVFDAMPSNPLEFNFVYTLTYPVADGHADSALAQTFYRYLQVAEAAVERTGSHWLEFLMMVSFADGDPADVLQGLTDKLIASDAKRFAETVRRLAPGVRAKVCGDRRVEGCVPRGGR